MMIGRMEAAELPGLSCSLNCTGWYAHHIGGSIILLLMRNCDCSCLFFFSLTCGRRMAGITFPSQTTPIPRPPLWGWRKVSKEACVPSMTRWMPMKLWLWVYCPFIVIVQKTIAQF